MAYHSTIVQTERLMHTKMPSRQESSHILVDTELVDLRIQGLDVDLNGGLRIISWFRRRTAGAVGIIISHPTQQERWIHGSGATKPTNNSNAQASRAKEQTFR